MHEFDIGEAVSFEDFPRFVATEAEFAESGLSSIISV
jgi:hypothetical protein